MDRIQSQTRCLAGIGAVAILLFALGACGPRVVSGNENAVVIENGPWAPISDIKSYAQNHCETHGKRPTYVGGKVIRGTLNSSYYYHCVAES